MTTATKPADDLPQITSAPCDVLTSDGEVVRLRPLGPEDLDAFVEMHTSMSKEAIYRRFFTERVPPEAVFARLLEPNQPYLVVGAELDGELIAAATCTASKPTVAEVAFAVADDHHGRGLGTLLFEELATAAGAAGITRFSAETLNENADMLEVFARMGYDNDTVRDRDGVRIDLYLDDEPVGIIDAREAGATYESIRRILEPSNVAVIGASRRRGSVGRAIVENLISAEFTGGVYPVNPRANSVAGVPCWASIDAIDAQIDVAIICVPSRAVLEVIDECGRAGVHGLVVITAGFAEAGDAADESELRETARHHGMRIIGPNCVGIVNAAPDVRLNATFAPDHPPAGPVGFASQSGALGIAMMAEAADLDIGVGSFVSLGNKADVSSNDMLQYWLKDPATDVGVLYLESFGNPTKFARIARRFSLRKPLIAVKSGRSESGRRAASSHTAALASDDTLADALFAETGIIRVDTLHELFDVTRLLVHQPLPAGSRVAIVGNSGGPGILAADACEARGLDVVELSDETQAVLRDMLPAGAAVANPVDLIAAADADTYEQGLTAVLADPQVDSVIAIYTNPVVTDIDQIAPAICRAAATHPDKPVVATIFAADVGSTLRVTEDDAGELTIAPIPVYAYPEDAAQALRHAAGLTDWRERQKANPAIARQPDTPPEATALIGRVLNDTPAGGWLEPDDVSALLRSHGIAPTPTTQCGTVEEAVAAAETVGWPVAVKVIASGVVHKTDVGGVHLDLDSAEAVRVAWDGMQDRLGAAMEGVIVQPMVPDGVELIVGALQDATFGPVVMVGAGGTEAEVWQDRAFALAPLAPASATRLVRSLRSSRLLDAYRGRPATDRDAVEAMLVRLAGLISAHPEVAEIEVNPVIVTPDGLHVVDARCRVTPVAVEPPRLRRRLR